MKKLYDSFDRFCARNNRKGIPNMMLYLAIGIAIVYVFTYIDPSAVLYQILRFDRAAILGGQVWRLVTYILVPNTDNILLLAIQLYFYYIIGRVLENEWGVFRFTLFYVSGVLLSAIGGMILGGGVTNTYINMALFLAYATLYPENRVLLLMIIPIKMKYLAFVYWVMLALGIITTAFPYNLFPLFSLLNYFFYFYPNIASWIGMLRHRYSAQSRNFRRETGSRPSADWAGGYKGKNGEKPYRHKCAVCGKTDTEYPDLDFRYCSRCNGYYCYCQEHINSHVHIQ